MIWAFDNKFYKLLDLIINSDISLLDSFQNSEVVNKKFKMLLVVEYIQSEIIDITLRNKTAINRIELSYNHREDDFHLFLMDNNKFCFNMNSIARINGDEVSLKYLKNINGVEKSLKNRINKETYCCLKDLLQHVNEYKKKYKAFFKVSKLGISGTGYMVLNIGVNRYIENGDGSPIVDVDVGLSLSAKDVLTIDELIDYKTILKHKTVMIEKIILASELNVSNAKIKSRKVKL